MLTECERRLGEGLLHLPARHDYRYGPQAEWDLLSLLFRSLAGFDEQRLRVLFPADPPRGSWKLSVAQGAKEGAEYTEAARGKRCGHIFRGGEATYQCATCAADSTCVLCSRCFDASDHTGHQYQILLASGNCGCCDCGDEEAWRVPLCCAIHTDLGDTKGKECVRNHLPQVWIDSIRTTISRVLDYFCDVISCSPEQLRLPKTEDGIKQDEEASRLHPGWYGEGDLPQSELEFALALWNDEKHTIRDMSHQVTRACRERDSFGLDKANETNDVGRSVVKYSKDLQRLLTVSKTIEQIKVTVTIRSSRDTFREQMCGAIVEWLTDIAGCSIGDDSEILRHIICEELLRPWRRGSGAYNADIGIRGIDDRAREKDERPAHHTINFSFSPAPPGELTFAFDEGEETVDNGENEEEGEDDEDFVETREDEENEYEEMEIDSSRLRGDLANEEDIEMGNADDELEVAEATLAGYPPPPPPPPHQTHNGQFTSPDRSSAPHVTIPRTPGIPVKPSPAKTPSHWQTVPTMYYPMEVPPHEDLFQRTRLDWMILFDLRLWKKTRTGLRDLYISTVVNVPQFKRIMGLRLAALYTALAQLYLIADREPDHSIVNLSLQLLTTPSITEEIVQRGNFLAKVMAILYTFLTTRQVGEPHEVDSTATLAFDSGSVTNRRLYHFFFDLKYLLQSKYVQQRVRIEERYLLQFLDLVKLPQGICPNIRAVGEHVEYETDAWISASILMREINRLCRQFCEAFRDPGADNVDNLVRAIKAAAISAILHSVGVERKRFDQAEIKEYVRFKLLTCFDLEAGPSGQTPRHRVVDFVVEKGSISFHHALHYTLSWLLECGRDMSSALMRDLLLEAAQTANDRYIHDSHLSAEDLLLTMFDYPLRVCAWLAQMKAGMWVRNGLSLRHQMSQYRAVSSRDFAYYRDIFLLQTALVACDPSRVLASIADRFGMVDWMSRNYVPRTGYEDSQIVDVAEEFVHLLVILLTDRTSLTAIDDDSAVTRENISRDIAHVLCFRPLSFSDLTLRLAEKFNESDMLQDVLDEIAIFRPPEGLNDTGTFELKSDYIDLVDPYSAHYSKNQRDEAENIYRTWMAKKTGRKSSDIIFEPKIRPIVTGSFLELPNFTKTLLFTQLVHHCVEYATCAKDRTPIIPPTRVEAFLQMVLHLILVAILEDDTEEDDMTDESIPSFVYRALCKSRMTQSGNITIVGLLEKISTMSEFESCGPKIRHILKRMRQRRPNTYALATVHLKFPYGRIDTGSPAGNTESEQEMKKRQALDRQARVMAQFQQQQQNFLNSQAAIDWGDDDLSDLESEAQGETEAKLWKYPSGTCILCQEETNDSRLYGTFALVQDSGILRQTNAQDPAYVREALRTPLSLDRSAEYLRPFGVAGENRMMVRKLDSCGGEVVTEKIGLSKGFPSPNTVRGPVTTGCGHIMHYSCFVVYYSAIQRRHSQQVARNHPEHINLKEFVCPLCKALGNAFLPIIWKGKEESYPGALKTSESFDRFMNVEVKGVLSRIRNYSLIMDVDKRLFPVYQELFNDYLSKAMISPLSMKIHQLKSSLPLPSHQFVQPTETPVSELVHIYRRLKATLRVNHVQSQFTYPLEALNGDELLYIDSLMRSFGYSISALEISQRGIESEPGLTLLDKIPQLTLTHLRVLAETALSYAAVGGVQGGLKSRSVHEFQEIHRQKLCQLFIGHPFISKTALHSEVNNIEPLLTMDAFIFLAECSLSILPILGIDIRHLIQMCYVAEIIKVATTFILCPIGLKELEQYNDTDNSWRETSDDRFEVTRGFIESIIAELRSTSVGRAIGSSLSADGAGSITPSIVIPLRRLAASYALPFLRKTAILLHVQHGVDFPNTGFGHLGASELDRLTKILQLPTLDEIFISMLPSSKGQNSFRSVVSGWIHHWNAYTMRIGIEDRALCQSLSHPTIFELVGLPKYYDTLIEEANRKRCPKSRKELSDPSICLFCGDIFCSQAVCCIDMDKKLGGCNQHLKKCGKNIGLFINIRKCAVLYLHNHNGSWHVAPYLDRHGEADPGLRRNRQLILNQKRYDRLLRDVWLSHSIPATISRKLEADINNGGWESI